MKKIFLILFALFLIVSCGEDPEAEAVQGALGGSCYPNKTCDGGLVCSEENNICEKDGDSADSGNSTDPDDSTDSGNENKQAECGNGVKEEGELCEEGEYVTCSKVDDKYSSSNFAICRSCSSWNTDECEEAQQQQGAQPLASFPARTHELTYLYNGVDDFSGMANQEDELWKSALFNASITMSGETYSIPNPQANVHWIAAYYDSSVLTFYQNSFLCDEEMNCNFTTPSVIFGGALSDLKAGKELSIGIADKNQVNMLIEDVLTTDQEQDCVMLVGYGTLTVDSVNIAAGAAGNFKFTTSKIGLYLPASTPEGDMTGELETAGFTICK